MSPTSSSTTTICIALSLVLVSGQCPGAGQLPTRTEQGDVNCARIYSNVRRTWDIFKAIQKTLFSLLCFVERVTAETSFTLPTFAAFLLLVGSARPPVRARGDLLRPDPRGLGRRQARVHDDGNQGLRGRLVIKESCKGCFAGLRHCC